MPFIWYQEKKTADEADKYKRRFWLLRNRRRTAEWINPLFFEIISGKIHCYYNQAGITREIDEHYSFGIVPGFQTPDWAKGAVMYQIFTDRFCNGDPSNDVVTGEYCYINEKYRR